MSERVNHPAHYGGVDNKYEAIKVIDAWRCNFNTGNAYKYMSRAGLKQSVDTVDKLREYLQKARWYLAHQLARLEVGCETAMVKQPFVVPSGYQFDMVMVGANLNMALEDAFRACFDQCVHHRVQRGIECLDAFLADL